MPRTMRALLTAKRDSRVDVLRGLALMMIFIDHVPANKLGWLTMHIWGYADAAEVFVLFAGFASMLAYGKAILRGGMVAGLSRIAARCMRLYSVHVLLLLITLVSVRLWARHFGLPSDFDNSVLRIGWRGIGYCIVLLAQPSFLNILPLYLVLLAAFPLMFLGLRYRPRLTVSLSVAIWAAAAAAPALNLPNWLEPQGWYFDPLSWQLIFMLGAVLAMLLARGGGVLPARPWLTAISVAYLVVLAFQSIPFEAYGVSARVADLLRPSHLPGLGWLKTPDKTHLGTLRILNAAAWVQIIFRAGASRAWMANAVCRVLQAAGRHSLPVFAVSCVIALFGRMAVTAWGDGLAMQLAINVLGGGGLLLLGWRLDHPPTDGFHLDDVRAFWEFIRTHQPRG